jgi:hypothetical protein
VNTRWTLGDAGVGFGWINTDRVVVASGFASDHAGTAGGGPTALQLGNRNSSRQMRWSQYGSGRIAGRARQAQNGHASAEP